MKHKLVALLCLFSFITFNLHAKIYNTTDIKDIMQSVEDSTLILFDIDETLIYPKTMLGSKEWFHFLDRHARDWKLEKRKDCSRFVVDVMKAIPVQLVDPVIGSLVSYLNDQEDIVVLALTARPYVPRDVPESNLTADQLLSVGIDFSQGLSEYNLNDIFKHQLIVRDGIIFTDGRLKGEELKFFLNQIGYRPGKIIFVDDKISQVESVHIAMEKEGISCDCYHYTKVASNPRQFDALISAIQLDHAINKKAIPTDADAEELKESYSHRAAEDYLLEVIKKHY